MTHTRHLCKYANEFAGRHGLLRGNAGRRRVDGQAAGWRQPRCVACPAGQSGSTVDPPDVSQDPELTNAKLKPNISQSVC